MMKPIKEIREVLSLQKQSLCEIYQITEIGSLVLMLGERRRKQVIYIFWLIMKQHLLL
jgi:hypothetical protein